MATRAQLQAQLDAIQAAKNTGALRVRHGDEDTIFRSLDEMDRIIRDLQNQIAAIDGTPPRSKVNYIEQTSRGLDGCIRLDKGFR